MKMRYVYLIAVLLLPTLISAQIMVVEIEVDTSDWTQQIISEDRHITFFAPNIDDLVLIDDHPNYSLKPSETDSPDDLLRDEFWIEITLDVELDTSPVGFLQSQDYVDNVQLDFNGRDAWYGWSYTSHAIIIQLENDSFASVIVYGDTIFDVGYQLAIEVTSTIHYSELENFIVDTEDLSENFVTEDGQWSVNYHPDWDVASNADGTDIHLSLSESMSLVIKPNQFDEDFDPLDFLINVVPDLYPNDPESLLLENRHAVFTTRHYEDNGETIYATLLFIKMENGLYTAINLNSFEDDFEMMRELTLQVAQTLHFIGEE